jgi:hypothetical protein
LTLSRSRAKSSQARTAFPQGKPSQIFPAEIERVIDDEPGGQALEQFPARLLAVEPLLQVVERADGPAGGHQQFPVEHGAEVRAGEHLGEGRADIIAAAREQRLAGGQGDDLHADAVEFPLRLEVLRPDGFKVAVFDRVRQHHRMKRGRLPGIRLGAASLQPGEQRLIGRGEGMPDLFHLVHVNPAIIGEDLLQEPRRHADAQRRGAQLQERPTLRRGHVVEQQGEIGADTGLVAAVELLDHLGQRRQAVEARRGGIGRPEMGHRFGGFPDIVVGKLEQNRIDARHDEIAHQRALEQLETQRAGDGGHGPAAVRVWRRLQILLYDGGLGQIAVGVIKAVEKRRECLHVGDGAT